MIITLEKQSPIGREISAAETRESILNALKKLPREFGLKHFSLMRAPGPDDEAIEPLVAESSLPKLFFRELDSARVMTLCPIVPLLKNIALPLCFSYLEDEWQASNIAMPKIVANFFINHGIITSVIMPLQSRDGSMFLMRLDGDRSILSLPELNELGMLTLQAFTVLDRLQHDDSVDKTTLTRRELEVLRWTSQGKTSAEIADILSLSEHTVNAYLNKAIRKLNCVNRTQLVAKALRLRMIT
ncbi:helix-turn-helix transcriptional regulator [Rhizobium oryzicola]|uniref:LuxR C-terminal-related transcriptional regulator n=1 Tax=Rhizobium oryzicola TaxID=1232668 RepID=A0ABT8SV91_9HYPH|nr:LuxR C-terminal-related transcriptional regulator [Rhizobium oryzicola]MDO1582281.1 LuxR C-terminal-related transcriptional regulator [Rhizobium oryzicola]